MIDKIFIFRLLYMDMDVQYQISRSLKLQDACNLISISL